MTGVLNLNRRKTKKIAVHPTIGKFSSVCFGSLSCIMAHFISFSPRFHLQIQFAAQLTLLPEGTFLRYLSDPWLPFLATRNEINTNDSAEALQSFFAMKSCPRLELFAVQTAWDFAVIIVWRKNIITAGLKCYANILVAINHAWIINLTLNVKMTESLYANVFPVKGAKIDAESIQPWSVDKCQDSLKNC